MSDGSNTPSDTGHTGHLIIRGPDVAQAVLLNIPVLTIGRAPDNNLTLADPEVSRHHAEVRLQPTGYMLTDLASANGTYIGATRVPAYQPYLLTEGATFRIGPYAITYLLSPNPEMGDERDVVPLAAETEPQEADHTTPIPTSPQATVRPAAEADVPPSTPPSQPVPPRATLPRPMSPAPLACGPTSRYLRDVPVIFQESDFLGRFLLIFESLWEPMEQRQDHLALYFDPHTCPASFLPWLANWLDLPFNPHWPETRRRRLLAEAMDLYRWRGTRYGLARMIEVCTGLTPEITEAPSQPFVFDIRIAAPTGTAVERDLIEDVIKTHKPACVGYRLEIMVS